MGTARSVARAIAPTCLRRRSAKNQEVLPFPRGEGGGGTASDEGSFQSCYAARKSRALRENCWVGECSALPREPAGLPYLYRRGWGHPRYRLGTEKPEAPRKTRDRHPATPWVDGSGVWSAVACYRAALRQLAGGMSRKRASWSESSSELPHSRSQALRENRLGRGVLGTPAGARRAPLPLPPWVGTPALQMSAAAQTLKN
jgi:hypothetical protein